ncbi:MAG: hypothetical protein IPJ34_07615 [Myxococcales bacterium]|nr:hypothetical protein [Myxococcales bacterium]
MRRPNRGLAGSGGGLAFAALLSTLFVASPGQAMPPYDPEWPPPAPTQPAGPPTPSMASLFGFQGLQQAARSPNAETRAAAVLRAAQLAKQKDTPTALGDDCWKLVESAANDAWGDDPDAALRVRLTAARALVDDRRAADARRALRDLFLTPGLAAAMMKGPFVVGAAPRTKLASPELVRLVRQTAAMALAILGDDDTLLTKVKDPEASPAAIAALAAHAPTSLVALLPKADSIPANDVIDALGKLGDLRAADASSAPSRRRTARARSSPSRGSAIHAPAPRPVSCSRPTPRACGSRRPRRSRSSASPTARPASSPSCRRRCRARPRARWPSASPVRRSCRPSRPPPRAAPTPPPPPSRARARPASPRSRPS